MLYILVKLILFCGVLDIVLGDGGCVIREVQFVYVVQVYYFFCDWWGGVQDDGEGEGIDFQIYRVYCCYCYIIY